MSNVPTPWNLCDGQQFRQLAHAGLICLTKHKETVNDLNVFPVPDGDTGTNMWMTMVSAYKAIGAESDELRLSEISKKLSRGALMGARGNSGVILSQIWRGMAKAFENADGFDAPLLAQSLRSATEIAYKGVQTPVEGTILTIIRTAAEEAEKGVDQTTDLVELIDFILSGCKEALAHTPEQLPVLKKAGVVDSGGQGFVYLLQGMSDWLHGNLSLEEALPVATAQQSHAHGGNAQALARPEDGEIENPYDVQYILLGKNLNVEEIRSDIEAMGDSAVIAGDSEIVKVHIHVKDPGIPLSYGIARGSIIDIVVENMEDQMNAMIETGGQPAYLSHDHDPHQNGHHAEVEIPTLNLRAEHIGAVAVAPGKGIANVYRSMGVSVIIDGGQTNNPSTEELLQAIEQSPCDRVILLPNNKNILLAANAANDLTEKEVVVIPTRTVPQGMSALVSYNPEGDLAESAEEMNEALGDIKTGQITIAVRTIELDGVEVEEGNWLSIVNGKLCASDTELYAVLANTYRGLELDECEILTIFYGADVSKAKAEEVAQQVKTTYPEVEIELFSGGQAHYHFIFGAE